MMNSRKVRIQTTLDSEIYSSIIKKLLPKYGHLNKLIEEAVKYLYAKEMGEVTELDHLLIRMMKEVGMVAIGFESAEHAASGDVEKAVKENEIEFMLEWYYGKPLSKISFEEAVNFLKVALLARNWASDVKINDEGDEVHVLVRSNVGKNLSEIFCKAVKHFAESKFGLKTDYSIYSHGFNIILKKPRL
jgi:hypothetical protein